VSTTHTVDQGLLSKSCVRFMGLAAMGN